MSAIKNFIVEHRRITIAIGCVIGLLLGLLTAAIVNRTMHQGKAEVPPGRIHDAGVFGDDITVYDSSNGPVVINLAASSEEDDVERAPLKLVADPDDIWTEDTYAGNYTMIEAVKQQNGSIGVLTIDKLGLSVNVYDSGTESMMEDMSKGIAHFPSTSAWDGCVAMSAHNVNMNGTDGYFKYLYTLAEGDTIRYSTQLGERTYTVQSSKTIAANDWTPTYHTDHNQVVLITCISGQPNNRLCVTAVEQAAA